MQRKQRGNKMIYREVSNTEFCNWIRNSDSYKNNFTWEGARALQEYLYDLSEELQEDLSFDPIAWCCEWSEYASIEEYQKDRGYENTHTIDELRNDTTVIEFDGGIIVQDF